MTVSIMAGLVVVLLFGACRSRDDAVSRVSPPNVLLITLDTMRADRVGAFGGPANITPILDRLAQRGARFLDAASHASLTVPAHASILTGQWPWVHTVRDNAGFVLPSSVPTLAEMLQARNYRTGAVVASFVLNSATGLGRGFDRYLDRFDTRATELTLARLQRRGAEVARDGAAWLREASSGPSPFFLWVHFYDPHAPYDAPPAFASRFPGQPYNAEVAATDWAVGDILGALSPEVAARTIVVATADHGESLDEHGEPEHGVFVYDTTQRVPLVIAAPNLPAGVSVKEQVRHIDLVPTILELVGAQIPSALPGQSLVPLLKGETRQTIPPSYAESWFGRLHFGWSEVRAVRTGDWKFVAAPTRELYDLARDPGETRNLAGERTVLADRLAAELQAIEPSGGTVVAPNRVDSATVERLRSLGYLGAGGGARPSANDEGADPKDRIADYVAFIQSFYASLADFEAGRLDRAVKGFTSLARQHPTSYEAHHYAGRALFALGRPRAALAEYEVVIGLSPNFAAGHFDAARAAAALGRFEAARGHVSRGLALEPESFYGQIARGVIEKAAGNAAGSREAFERALSINPGMALAHFELGQLAEARGDADEATQQYERAIAGDADFVAARRALDGVRTRLR